MGEQISRGMDDLSSGNEAGQFFRGIKRVGQRLFEEKVHVPAEARLGDGQIRERRRADDSRIRSDLSQHLVRIRKKRRPEAGLPDVCGQLFVDIRDRSELGLRDHVHNRCMQNPKLAQTDNRDPDPLLFLHVEFLLRFPP
jgi:hypothetical protein